jgi:hypothetical protein
VSDYAHPVGSGVCADIYRRSQPMRRTLDRSNVEIGRVAAFP